MQRLVHRGERKEESRHSLKTPAFTIYLLAALVPKRSKTDTALPTSATHTQARRAADTACTTHVRTARYAATRRVACMHATPQRQHATPRHAAAAARHVTPRRSGSTPRHATPQRQHAASQQQQGPQRQQFPPQWQPAAGPPSPPRAAPGAACCSKGEQNARHACTHKRMKGNPIESNERTSGSECCAGGRRGRPPADPSQGRRGRRPRGGVCGTLRGGAALSPVVISLLSTRCASPPSSCTPKVTSITSTVPDMSASTARPYPPTSPPGIISGGPSLPINRAP